MPLWETESRHGVHLFCSAVRNPAQISTCAGASSTRNFSLFCKRVNYCSDKCTENHREQHEEECKIRAAILHDNELFTQPDGSHRGECPICFLPMPLDHKQGLFQSCCSEYICNGCIIANWKSNGNVRCPFCRESWVDDKVAFKRLSKRVKANDPVALHYMGNKRVEEGDYQGAFECWTKAAELGDAIAHHQLGNMYDRGDGVEKDFEKAVYHYEKAAIGGHPIARHNLGAIEEKNGNIERAVKHLIIAANLGFEASMKGLWVAFSEGNITKEVLDATLRTHQAAIDAMKSPEREAAEAFYNSRR